ncbi:MAG: hypothetical protein IJ605_04120 [Prevotella sp.]|nr:hypothetical protein [Prevotella sp.]
MDKKIYQQPSVKVLENAIKLLFEPGGGVSESTPVTPGVNPAKEMMDEDYDEEALFQYPHYSVWDD